MLKKDSFVELSFCEMAISTNGHSLDWVLSRLDGHFYLSTSARPPGEPHTQIISEFQKNPVDNVEEFAIDTKVMI